MQNYNYGVRHHKVTGSVLRAILKFTITNDESVLKAIYEPLSNLSKEMKKKFIVDAITELKNCELSHMSSDMLNDIYTKAMKATKPVVFETPTLVTEDLIKEVNSSTQNEDDFKAQIAMMLDEEENEHQTSNLIKNDNQVVTVVPSVPSNTNTLSNTNNNNSIHICLLETYDVNSSEDIELIEVTEQNKEKVCPNLPKNNEDVNLPKTAENFKLKGYDTFHINKKIPSLFEKRYVASKLLKAIHSDVEVASEMCIFYISLIQRPYIDENSTGYTSWHPSVLTSIFGSKYVAIQKALLTGTKNGAIIETDGQYIVGEKCKGYRMTETYAKCGYKLYQPKTQWLKDALRKYHMSQLSKTDGNVIVKNMFSVYGLIQLPTHDEIIAEAKRIIKTGETIKGSKLVYLNKQSRAPYLDQYGNVKDGIRIVEDQIELFDRLVEAGYLIPSVTESSAGRVCDSFTLMPSWIRKLVKINGERIVECDYKCLHPNIAMSLYGGNGRYLTHSQIASDLDIPTHIVKHEHVSFFNRNTTSKKVVPGFMESSVLFNYYREHHPQMLANIIDDKMVNGYKITYKKMFNKEVDIMTDVINTLNEQGIYVIYVYDALYCHPMHKETLTRVMNETIIRYGVFTKVGE